MVLGHFGGNQPQSNSLQPYEKVEIFPFGHATTQMNKKLKSLVLNEEIEQLKQISQSKWLFTLGPISYNGLRLIIVLQLHFHTITAHNVNKSCWFAYKSWQWGQRLMWAWSRGKFTVKHS